MIVDILELPFKGDVLPKYGAIVPVVLSQPHAPDDVYLLGYDTTAPIHNKLHRYKIIEHINGEVFEHITISEFKLNIRNKNNKDNRPVFIITTRHHHNGGITTYRYFKAIERILQLLNVNGAYGVRTVHQMAINAFNQLHTGGHNMSDMEIFLGQYVNPRHQILTHLTTASISEAIGVMVNIKDIYESVRSAIYDPSIAHAEINEFLDTNLHLPKAPPYVGLCGLLMSSKIYQVSMLDLIPLIDKDSFGMYQSIVPTSMPVQIKDINEINAHLKENFTDALDKDVLTDALDNTTLLESLTDLELCNYTDISIEFAYAATGMPDFHIYYSGSVFNHCSVSNVFGTIMLSLDISKLYRMLKTYYNEDQFDIDQPTVQICKTFAEEVYIKFITKTGHECVDFFDLTILSILSPVVLDSTAEEYIWKQIHLGF